MAKERDKHLLDEKVEEVGRAAGASHEEIERVKQAGHNLLDEGIPEPLLDKTAGGQFPAGKNAGPKGDATGPTKRDREESSPCGDADAGEGDGGDPAKML